MHPSTVAGSVASLALGLAGLETGRSVEGPVEADAGVPDSATAPKAERLAFLQDRPGVYPETLGYEDASAHTDVLDPA